MYDGVREYHVQARESGTRSQKQTESELRSKTEDCQSCESLFVNTSNRFQTLFQWRPTHLTAPLCPLLAPGGFRVGNPRSELWRP